ncbi:hypothetical protein BKA66DRAFT_576870 [Pyrenochaeta sp. MPI-SDFR-AT-0127]|nr:hypothetical protein BKA66DRAFT_576870 [Pyrenochaeta sp. MPI-SDFR-AT-0127]
MRLRSQKEVGAEKASNQATTHPQSLPAAPSLYQGAYNRGYVPGPDGSFHHFIRVVDESHMLNGYWKFGSYADDRSAHARGLDTPESVLLAQDRGEESYDDIAIRWIPGMNNLYLKRPLSGSAAQHLETIYETKRILGEPMSLRNQVPVYSNQPHNALKQFWENKERMEQKNRPTTPTLSTSIVLSSSQPSGASSHSVLSTSSPQKQLSDSSRRQKNCEESTNNDQGTTVRALVTDHTQTCPLNSVPQNSAKDWGLRKASAHNNVKVPPPETSHLTNISISDPNKATQASQPGPPLYPAEGRTDAPSPSQSSQLTTHPSLAYTLGSLRSKPRGHQYCSPYSTSPAPARPLTHDSVGSVDTPYNVPTGTARTFRPESTHTSVALIAQARTLKDSTLPEQQSQYHIVPIGLHLSGRGEVESTTKLPHTSFKLSSGISSDTQLDPTRGVRRTRRPRLPTTVNGNSSIELGTDAASTGWEQSKKFANSPQKSRSREGMVPDGTNSDDHVASNWLSDPKPWPHGEMEAYSGLPCMDCELNVGHKWDCHIGNLKPMKNLTELDYRSLADAVERFDPGPWTTHFNLFPRTEPEEPAAQIEGMAAVIRDEASYKSDPELHVLPDEVMIMLWAFKVSPNVEVVEE